MLKPQFTPKSQSMLPFMHRYEKNNGDGSMGRVVKGTISQFGRKAVEKSEGPTDIMKEI